MEDELTVLRGRRKNGGYMRTDERLWSFFEMLTAKTGVVIAEPEREAVSRVLSDMKDYRDSLMHHGGGKAPIWHSPQEWHALAKAGLSDVLSVAGSLWKCAYPSQPRPSGMAWFEANVLIQRSANLVKAEAVCIATLLEPMPLDLAVDSQEGLGLVRHSSEGPPIEWLDLPELPIPEMDNAQGEATTYEVQGFYLARSSPKGATFPVVAVFEERSVVQYRLPLHYREVIAMHGREGGPLPARIEFGRVRAFRRHGGFFMHILEPL